VKPPMVWVVLWIDERGHGVGTCGHGHLTADEATMCPWEPAPVPPIGAGLVREVRDSAYQPAHLSDPAYIARRDARDGRPAATAQLELALGAL